MKKIGLGYVGVVGLLFVAGCSTVRSGSSIEGRVATLENKVQTLESESQGQGASGAMSVSADRSKGVTADSMSKKEIQKALKNAGYYEGVVDGKMGPKTRAAIMEFQKNMGLKADGVAGRNTKEKLLKYLE